MLGACELVCCPVELGVLGSRLAMEAGLGTGSDVDSELAAGGVPESIDGATIG
jgi:hypothetical protein